MASEDAARAQLAGPSVFFYEGYLTDGSGNPMPGNKVVDVELFDGLDSCRLFKENFPTVPVASDGRFSIQVGTGNRVPVSSTADGLSLADLMVNGGAFNGNSGSGLCTPTIGAGDRRYLRITVNSAPLTPSVPVGGSPYAMVADSLQGLGPVAFIRAQGAVTQATINSLASASSSILAVASGTSPLYARSTAGGGAIVAPGSTGTPASPVVGAIWFDTSTSKLRVWDGASAHDVGASAGVAVAPGAGIWVNGVATGSSTGGLATISLADTGVGPGPYLKVTVDSKGRVTGGGTLVDADIPTLVSVNKVSPTAIGAGTIPGFLAVNGGFEVLGTAKTHQVSTGTIYLHSAGTIHDLVLQAAPSMAAGYAFTFPASPGSLGQVLVTNGTGQTSWQTVSAGIGGGATASGTNGAIQLASSGSFTSSGSFVFIGGKLGVGVTGPAYSIDIGGTDGVRLPAGTDGTRPAHAAGLVRYNTTSSALEVSNGTIWKSLDPVAGGTLDGVGFVTGPGAVAITAGTGDNAVHISAAGAGNLNLAAGPTGMIMANSPMNVTSVQSSSSPTNGALVVAGGVGIGGALNVSGAISSTSSIYTPMLVSPLLIGSSTAGSNLSIDSTSNASKGSVLIAVAGGSVGIATASPSATLDVGGTGAIRVPQGPTAGAPQAGMIRYNTVSQNLEMGVGATAVWKGVESVPTGTLSGTFGLIFGRESMSLVNQSAASSGTFATESVLISDSAVGGAIGPSASFVGLQALAKHDSTVSTGSFVGGAFAAQTSAGGGPAQALIGVKAAAINLSTNSVQKSIGVAVSVPPSSGASAFSAGIFIDKVSGGTAWGVFQSDTVPSFFGGAIGVSNGTSAGFLPMAAIDARVSGTSMIQTGFAGQFWNETGGDTAVTIRANGAKQYRLQAIAPSGTTLSGPLPNGFAIMDAFTPRLVITSAGSIGIGTNTPTEMLDVSGAVLAKRFKGTVITPTPTFSSGAGTSASGGFSGSNFAFTVGFTAGSSPSASAIIFSVSLPDYAGTTPICTFSPATQAAAALIGAYVETASNSVVLKAGATAVTSGLMYAWSFVCAQ